MLLTISTNHKPTSDLGYLMHKKPGRVQTVDISVGNAHIFYPEINEEVATIALLLDIDTVGLVRSKSNSGFALEQYVNDRPYVASSILASAISKAFATAMNGRCKDKPELVDTPMAFTVTIASLPAMSGKESIEKLFGPLGYTVEAIQQPLDTQFPDWEMSRYNNVTLTNTLTAKELLSHLYVLIPVLDNDKHYFVGQHEIEKLFDKGKGWLEKHPDRDFIVRRYLKNLSSLTRQAFSQLVAQEEAGEPEKIVDDEEATTPDEAEKIRLHDLRLLAAKDELLNLNAKRVADLGCGEGKLLKLLFNEKQFEQIIGVDISYRSLEYAKEKLRIDGLPDKQKARLQLYHGSLTYKDARIKGLDAVALVEVIEHLDTDRIDALEKSVFGFAKPNHVIITTPNAEYNALFETLSAGQFRHSDHRFEWTRDEFNAWCKKINEKYNYSYTIKMLGDVHETYGGPSQMAIFSVL